jgi:hypothetical protein
MTPVNLILIPDLLLFLLIPLLVVSSALAQENNLENKLAKANSTSKGIIQDTHSTYALVIWS